MPNPNEQQVELESQFVMRLPPEPAKILREALRSSLPLKDRLTIKLENDMRYGEVRVDHWLLHAKVMDLPTIVESLKTIDNKSFYKTADICQIVICKEEDDPSATDEESPVKQKKKDPNKVDKKFLWPHGVTPPTKNVRRRRFRKTLKKKYVEAPEIEKEVKRLLRVDNDAVNVKWEVICEDEDQSKPSKVSSSGTVKTKRESINGNTSQSLDVAEHDIFGEAVSDSEDDDEEANINVMELDENSRLSADSRVSDSNSMQATYSERSSNNATTSSGLVTEFSKEMFQNDNNDMEIDKQQDDATPKIAKLEQFHSEYIISENYTESPPVSASKDSRLATLHAELTELRQRRQQQEIEIANIENVKLRQRFQEILDNLLTQEMQKVQEIQELELE
ncbi:transcription initiation factor TFIID subunit 7 isoform X1 [Ooceraea biroi]|uniref:transcription initiation factor TFIID subunit 7 isoform X1 n=1 Tax=Ooceraea biroi TaxID=2015173 RepID=UPI000F090368|nr:transcription initiation factor TFIID subunit 7 isoform X1 [Ooceraea biroi]XP_026826392.1 transcription initiation factor TFIID subunit 7 isoform X1 [Ooceraea biroi]XP_026826393.1 transcription initiation factor TFIID subunit 7 isoform X1 [Ooceraea biroi]XP_026826394.1 transcription initiation factor TFIID subunit 7 isoform X1 [Ooceraea biroi]XP_026826395.1 transcription initiation factor TFIID subunit 7 isoform X1 [Ooceraea biroi]